MSATVISPEEILDRVDDLYRSSSSHGTMTMTIATSHWQRALSLEFWAKGKDRSLVRIISPKKEQGTATLRAKNDIWNYLPKVKRVIKLPSSMMSASWMGSHFTNDDLVKESRFTEDYDFEVSYQGVRDGQPVIEITCTPKADAAVVWGKVVVTVRQADYLPVSNRYYDEELRLARTMTFSELKRLGGKLLPGKLTVAPEDKPGEKTTVSYEAIDFDPGLDDDLFSLRNLQQ